MLIILMHHIIPLLKYLQEFWMGISTEAQQNLFGKQLTTNQPEPYIPTDVYMWALCEDYTSFSN